MKTSSTSGFVLVVSAALAFNLLTSVYCYKHLIKPSDVPPEPPEDAVCVINVPVENNVITLVKHEMNDCDIESPIPDLNPVAQNIYLETHAGTTFLMPDKTKIIVPAFAFTDASGHIIDAEVEMQVREFQNPYEIFLSGIPLSNDSQTLEPATLIELQASSFGKRVFIRHDNPLTMIPAESIDTGFRMYKLDSCEWILRDSKKRVEEVNVREGTETVSETENKITTPGKYAIALKCKTKMEETREFFFSGKHRPDHFIFSIVNYVDLHPELKPLTTVNWICTGSDALENYHIIFGYGQEKLFAEKIIYDDRVRISRTQEDYFLEYALNDKQIRIRIKPYIINSADQLNFELAFNAYIQNHEKETHPVDSTNNDVANTNTPETVNNVFTIDSLGIWCLGRNFTPHFPKHVTAAFIDEAGRKINVDRGWMLLNGKTLFVISDFTNFGFDPFSKAIFWTILPGNKIGIVYPEEFRRHRNDHGVTQLKIRQYEENNILTRKLGVVL